MADEPEAFDELRADFLLLEDWEERYGHVIELGRALPPLPDAQKTPATRVRGCAAQVWLVSRREPDPAGGPDRLVFAGESDAQIVQGLIRILIALYSHRTPAEILAIDARAELAPLGLLDALTAQRANGLFAMVERIRAEAGRAAAGEG
ncbi:MAG: SufE family protein [Alphaproteobacteria bacterium]|nr:SufE family protein [Alphaproteobacteria bacterium]